MNMHDRRILELEAEVLALTNVVGQVCKRLATIGPRHDAAALGVGHFVYQHGEVVSLLTANALNRPGAAATGATARPATARRPSSPARAATPGPRPGCSQPASAAMTSRTRNGPRETRKPPSARASKVQSGRQHGDRPGASSQSSATSIPESPGTAASC